MDIRAFARVAGSFTVSRVVPTSRLFANVPFVVALELLRKLAPGRLVALMVCMYVPSAGTFMMGLCATGAGKKAGSQSVSPARDLWEWAINTKCIQADVDSAPSASDNISVPWALRSHSAIIAMAMTMACRRGHVATKKHA